MDKMQNSNGFSSQVYLSVIQRESIVGKSDYFILARGVYAERDNTAPKAMVVGNYASSFGEAFSHVEKILKEYSKNFFFVEALNFSRKGYGGKRKDKIKRLILTHNTHRDLEKRI